MKIKSKKLFLFVCIASSVIVGFARAELWGDDVESKIDELLACSPIPLNSGDVSGGSITLSTAGNYCLSEDITSNIFITTSCVSLDLNDRCLTGYVSITGDETMVKNGTILPTAAGAAPGIIVGSAADRTHITNVVIKAEDGAGIGGISMGGADCIIEGCTINSGSGATNGSGGYAIELSALADRTLIKNCTITTGAGGASSGSAGGDGGTGILISSSNTVIVEDCTIFSTGAGGVGDGSNNGGNGGIGIHASSCSYTSIVRCIVQATGNGANGFNATGGDGGHGIKVDSSTLQVSIGSCLIQNLGNGGSGDAAGSGGHGVFIEGDTCAGTKVRNCDISNTGSAGTGTGQVEGMAVRDEVTTAANVSLVVSNFAYNIANSIRYYLQNVNIEAGFDISNPPTSTAVSVYTNVFI